jgi:hypothetical protein
VPTSINVLSSKWKEELDMAGNIELILLCCPKAAYSLTNKLALLFNGLMIL